MGEEGVILRTDDGQLFSTNSTGTAFFQKLSENATAAHAITSMLDVFDVEEDVLVTDLCEMVSALEAEGVVIVEHG